MKSLKFIYNPNSNITLKITASNILKFYNEFLDTNKKVYEINDNQMYDYMININFRPCVEGEIYRSESDTYFFFFFFLNFLFCVNFFLLFQKNKKFPVAKNVKLGNIHLSMECLQLPAKPALKTL